MKFLELGERVVTNNVTIEDKEQPLFISLPQDALGELERTGSTECHFLLGVGDLDLVLLFKWLERGLDVVCLIVDGDDDFHHSDSG